MATIKGTTQTQMKIDLIAYISRADVRITEYTIQHDIASRSLDGFMVDHYDTGRSSINVEIEREIKKAI